jgi:SAM-dependent methyltransferase
MSMTSSTTPQGRSQQVRAAIARAMLIPRVAWLSVRTPKNLLTGWNHYWSNVRSTGVGGDVLWDSGDLDEIPRYLPMMTQHLDLTLPMIDMGCGNGRFTRALAPHVPSVLGIDLSPNAIALARQEANGLPKVTFRAIDATMPGATRSIAAEIGPANVFVRGVFHILSPSARVELARNLLPLVGSRGRVFLSETDFRGSSLEYLESLGATARRIPEPLERAIRDLPRPGHFGTEDRAATFPEADWTVLADGPTMIKTIPLRGTTQPELIPGYFAIMAPRAH